MRLTIVAFAVAVLAAGVACKEGGTIKVHSLSFKGVKGVDENRLKDALATRQSSKIPWGKKSYFDRSRFDADLKRVQAFYADRGFPDARVTGFDVKLNDKQDEVDLTVTIAEGEPVLVKSIDFAGFEDIPPAHLNDLKKRVPLTVGKPRDRQLVVSTRELAVNELKDHGFPYGKVATDEDDGADGRQATADLHGRPRQARALRHRGNRRQQERRRAHHPPAAHLQAGRAVPAQRGAGLAAAALRPRAVPVRERRAAELGAAARRSAGARDGGGGQAPARELRRRLRHRGKGARRRRIPPRQFSRRRANGRRARALVIARSRGAARFQPAVFLPSPSFARRRRPAVVHLYAGLYLGGERREADLDPPQQRAHVVGRVDHQRARRQLDHRRRLQRSGAAHLPDRARPRSRPPKSRTAT